MPSPDPRLAGASSDPRTLRVVSRHLEPEGEVILKAARPAGLRRRLPSALEVEHERSLWGPHDSPLVSWIEEDLYNFGYRYLRGFIGAVLGRDRLPVVAKADAPKPPGWGDVMRLFQAPEPPEQKLATWETLLDGFTHALLPGHSLQDQAAAWALRSNLLHAIGERVRAVTVPGAWDAHFRSLPPSSQQSLDWAKVHGAQIVTRMTEKARQVVLDALVSSQMSGANHHELSRVLLEKLGTLNRDWRRIAITETAMAISSGQLASVADSGEWEAIWVAGPKACAFCQRMNGRTFRVVRADSPVKDPDTDVWPGKTNVGRSASLHRRDGSKRTKEELWQPAQPAHPLCMCSWAIRRRLTTSAGKNAAAKLAAIQAARFKAAVG